MQTYHLAGIRPDPPRLWISEYAWSDNTTQAFTELGEFREHPLPEATTEAADEKLAKLGWDRRGDWTAQDSPEQPFCVGIARRVVEQ